MMLLGYIILLLNQSYKSKENFVPSSHDIFLKYLFWNITL